jgi:hypothetical protein
MNCFCEMCEDSQEVLIAIVLGVYEHIERKFVIPCPDCTVPIVYSIVSLNERQSLPSAGAAE